MGFWTTSDNKAIKEQNSFETGGGDIEPIPAKTQVKAAIDEAKWDDYDGEEYISLRWTVLAPEQYKNRKIFQKVRVTDSDPKKADKAKNMLAAIATNAGGGLLKIDGVPSDMDLQANLLHKPMAILLQVWKIKDDQTGDEKSGNWVSAVSQLNAGQPLAKAAPSESVAEQKPVDTSFDDDVGF